MKIKLLIALLSIVFLSCENNKEEDGLLKLSVPKAPKTETIDLSDDNIPDIEISYYELQTLDIPSSGGSIVGSISPIGDTMLLYKKSGESPLLKKSDVIYKADKTETKWYKFPKDIVSINRKLDTWDKSWKVLNYNNLSEYYVGIKLISDSYEKIGWIKLSISTTNGKIDILDKSFTPNESLEIK
jgi:hypothetical protein